jgi:L-lactate dehydrogenase complex protein LldE
MVARRFGDEALARRAEAVAARTFELSELLVDVLGVEDVGAYYPHRVTYHPTCHSLRLLRVGDRPLRLLRNVAAIDLVELPDAEVCCGFGGTFAVKNGAVSTAMLADKMRCVLATSAEVCTAGDSSCLMHIGGGLSRLHAGTATVHLAEIWPVPRTTSEHLSPACHTPRGVGHLRGEQPFPWRPAPSGRHQLPHTRQRRPGRSRPSGTPW